ncbi:MAG: hypothetical protein Q8P17_01610, partial [bacterium]|nr:hypothetical protein [bacterium]
MLLVAAVFLNFSLFLSEAVIDTGNLFATQFYTQINGGQPAGAKNFDLLSIKNEGISNKIMGQLGLQTIYGNAITNPQVFKSGNSFIIGFMGSILFLVTAFVLFSLAFILIARFVILIFLIILAPIGFAGLAIPQLKGTADKWWHKLFEQTITAPILLLLLYIALAVITDVQFLTGFGIAEGAKTSGGFWLGFIANGNLQGFAGILLSFLVAMGLLIAVVILSKKLSAFGAAGASALAGKLTFGATAFAGRRTVGRVSNYASRKIRSSKFGRSDMGKLFVGVADRGAKASFDIRGATIAGGLKALKIDAGDAQKGGYHAREEELMKSRIDYAKTLRQTGTERTAAEQANTAKDELVGAHDTKMKDLEKEEQAQLKRVREATTKEDKEAEKEKVDEIRNRIGLEKNSHQTAISEQDLIIKKNSSAASQKEYGEALRKKTVFGVIPRFPYDWPTAVGSARREASSRIIGEANKDASLKKLDEIENMLARQSKAGPASAASTPSTPAAPAP